MDIQVIGSTALRGCRIACARAYQQIAWPGVVGLVLMTVSGGVLLQGFAAQVPLKPDSVTSSTAVAIRPQREAAEALNVVSSIPPIRRARHEVPLILARIGEISSAAGLGWPAAEYSTLNATETQSAALEVRCTLKGQYPQVRAALARLLRTIPGLTLRELTISRPHSDTLIVESRIVLAILLNDEAPVTGSSASEVQ